jgi:LmbE family N-acetylglucosaminyl deacetylase
VVAQPTSLHEGKPSANLIDAPGTAESCWQEWTGFGGLPVASVASWRSAVVVAAHPDDEVLGVGGTMSILAASGARLRLVAITDGEASHPGITDPAALAERRADETTAALGRLGAADTEVVRLRMPDTGLARLETEITSVLNELAAGFDVCLAPWPHDAHADHEAAGRAARRACESTLCYPVWMWHWARPGDRRVPWHRGLCVPLDPAQVTAKQAAIGCFASQLEVRPASAEPVLPPGIVAHFTRTCEVLFA